MVDAPIKMAEAANEEDYDPLEWEARDASTPWLVHMVAGSMAGASEHLLVYPIDTVKTRVQAAVTLTTVQTTSSSLPSQAPGVKPPPPAAAATAVGGRAIPARSVSPLSASPAPSSFSSSAATSTGSAMRQLFREGGARALFRCAYLPSGPTPLHDVSE
eukprot:GHVU01102019.1.p2 GENE.GHVU01102019.1~~GHVU01102019.1.p2  ORF type:complete len:159 (+),score=29.42 GHVU01102019.1:3899-4375(+)